MAACGSNTHRLRVSVLGSQTTRSWIRLVDGAVETDAATIAALETSANGVECEAYTHYLDQTLCEIDAEYLLLIDSGGRFGRYSFYTGEWELVNTLSVRSSGGLQT